MAPVHKNIALLIFFTRRIVSTRKAVMYHVFKSTPNILKLIRLQFHIHKNMHNPSQTMCSTPILLSVPLKHQRTFSLLTQCPTILYNLIHYRGLKTNSETQSHHIYRLFVPIQCKTYNLTKGKIKSWRTDSQYNWKELFPDQGACLRINMPIKNHLSHIATHQEDPSVA